jgi:hypothetical protein
MWHSQPQVVYFAEAHGLATVATLRVGSDALRHFWCDPGAIEGFGSLPGESRRWQATFYRHALVRGVAVLATGMALGRSAQVRFAHAGSLYIFAWLGVLLPLTSFAVGLFQNCWSLIQMYAGPRGM